MTKKEFIKLAYGSYWEVVKDHIDENGFLEHRKLGHGLYSGISHDFFFHNSGSIEFKSHFMDGVMDWRPRQLQGLESNNGWFKTEEVFPSDKDIDLEVCVNGVYSQVFHRRPCEENNNYFKSKFSHWRPMRKIINPLY